MCSGFKKENCIHQMVHAFFQALFDIFRLRQHFEQHISIAIVVACLDESFSPAEVRKLLGKFVSRRFLCVPVLRRTVVCIRWLTFLSSIIHLLLYLLIAVTRLVTYFYRSSANLFNLIFSAS